MPPPSSRKPGPPSASPGAPPLRADARENRRRILDAARAVFAERGLDAPVLEVVRRSGVGAATLYRRFPTREALITEVFTEQVTACVSVVLDASRDPDPWRGFCAAVEGLCALDAADRGFTGAFLSAFPGRVDVEDQRERAERAFADLARRAQDAGELRADFSRHDLTLLLMANRGIVHEDPDTRLAASRRLAAYLLQGFRAGTATPLPPVAVLTGPATSGAGAEPARARLVARDGRARGRGR
ncbi:TetR/AcrR family transcriptional regulator [Quadrisphaera sp. DSM 44207]|uniref:TetR/AcrR family transcriptional regulator n=1 Tax=Quadrisphaera sp. DSM 44207 TaxID=1881057 RepID=UPI000888D234|nr:TetR/AcrR family transcriptional regulator [Quadrisphaera sp. DSM 44207]SDQ13858.1 transcriptional regulator, TetR family [Quadrisphaera sp. DSM 44207]